MDVQVIKQVDVNYTSLDVGGDFSTFGKWDVFYGRADTINKTVGSVGGNPMEPPFYSDMDVLSIGNNLYFNVDNLSTTVINIDCETIGADFKSASIVARVTVSFKYVDDTIEEKETYAYYSDRKSTSKGLISFLFINENKKSVKQVKIKELNIQSFVSSVSFEISNLRFLYTSRNASFQASKVGDIFDVTYYEYFKYDNEVGRFKMIINPQTEFANEIEEDCYLFVDKKDWLLVQDINVDTEKGYEIIGTDLKGLLNYRCTLPAFWSNNKMPFDSVEGTTEKCCKHYILNNIVNPINPKRIIPLVVLAENQGRGKADDNYTSRLENVDEVIKKLCENGNIYYDMNVDLINNKIIFDVKEYIDKSINQDIKNRVVFNIDGNVARLERSKGVSTYKNVFYATRQAGTNEEDLYVIEQHWSAADIPKGIARKEKALYVSCDTDEEISKYAIFSMLDYYKIDSIKVEPADIEAYGEIYEIGDIVTIVYDDYYIDTPIKSVGIIYSKDNLQETYTLNLGFGNAKPKPLEYLNKKIKNKGV